MNLATPVTIQPPTIVHKGQTIVPAPITLSTLEITILDSASRKSCVAQIRPCPYPLVLWSGAAYDAIGDYTQAQVDARILELLGTNVKANLEALFTRQA